MEVPEIREIIYTYWAKYRLQKICQDFEIDYPSLCELLLKYNGLIYGLMLVHCFRPDLISKPNRLNICFFGELEDPLQKIREIMPQFTINFHILKDSLLLYTEASASVKIHVLEKIQNKEEIVLNNSFLNATAIGFTGTEWIIPAISIHELMESNRSRVLWKFSNVPTLLEHPENRFSRIFLQYF